MSSGHSISAYRSADGSLFLPIPAGIALVRTVDWRVTTPKGEVDVEVLVEFESDGACYADVTGSTTTDTMDVSDLMASAATWFAEWKAAGVERAKAEVERDINDRAETAAEEKGT